MLREPAEPTAAEPKQSGSFRYLQGMLEAGEGGKPPATLPRLPSHSLRCREARHTPPPAPLLPVWSLQPHGPLLPCLLRAVQTPCCACWF